MVGQNTSNPSSQSLDDAAIDALVEAAYPDLKRMARRQLRRESSRPFQTTELVNEAVMRWFKGQRGELSQQSWMAIMARVMRNVLVDEARARHASKRGNNPLRITLATADGSSEPGLNALEVLDLDTAIGRLHALDNRKAHIIECHYFGGMTVAEMAEHLKISPATVKRDLSTARAWIGSQLQA